MLNSAFSRVQIVDTRVFQDTPCWDYSLGITLFQYFRFCVLGQFAATFLGCNGPVMGGGGRTWGAQPRIGLNWSGDVNLSTF